MASESRDRRRAASEQRIERAPRGTCVVGAHDPRSRSRRRMAAAAWLAAYEARGATDPESRRPTASVDGGGACSDRGRERDRDRDHGLDETATTCRWAAGPDQRSARQMSTPASTRNRRRRSGSEIVLDGACRRRSSSTATTAPPGNKRGAGRDRACRRLLGGPRRHVSSTGSSGAAAPDH